MTTYITTANYLNLHRIFLCFENKYGQTGKTVSKTNGAAIRAAIKELQLSILLRQLKSAFSRKFTEIDPRDY